LTDRDRDRLRQGLAEPEFVARKDADQEIEPQLARYPASLAYRRANPLGLKLFDIGLGQGRIRFCDSDVLFLRPVTGLFDVSKPGGAVFLQDIQNAYSLRSWQILRHRLRLPVRVNTGLFSFPRQAFDLDLVDWYLGRPEMGFAPMWREQTAWALLAGAVETEFLDPSHFQIARCGPEQLQRVEPPAMLHFVTPSRPYFPAWRAISGSSVVATRLPSTPLTPARLLAEEGSRRFRRI
jgi:hypothetical protein